LVGLDYNPDFDIAVNFYLTLKRKATILQIEQMHAGMKRKKFQHSTKEFKICEREGNWQD